MLPEPGTTGGRCSSMWSPWFHAENDVSIRNPPPATGRNQTVFLPATVDQVIGPTLAIRYGDEAHSRSRRCQRHQFAGAYVRRVSRVLVTDAPGHQLPPCPGPASSQRGPWHVRESELCALRGSRAFRLRPGESHWPSRVRGHQPRGRSPRRRARRTNRTAAFFLGRVDPTRAASVRAATPCTLPRRIC